MALMIFVIGHAEIIQNYIRLQIPFARKLMRRPHVFFRNILSQFMIFIIFIILFKLELTEFLENTVVHERNLLEKWGTR